MADEQVIVVTGVAGYWGRRVAEELLEQDELHVIGIDRDPLQVNIDGLDYIQADVRNPLLAELLQEEQVETVVHLQFRESTSPSESAFDQNVMGTAKLLAACEEADIGKVIVKSTTMVYGARPENAMFLREEHPLNGTKKYGYIRDALEIESYCKSFGASDPGQVLTVLRFGHIVGPNADTPMTRFLRDNQALLPLGFDPMMQFIHEDDVVAALVQSIMGEYRGAFNVAAEKGMPLWKTMGLANKLTVPVLHPLAYWSVSLGGPRLAPIPVDYLRYPCIGDVSKMKDVMEFTPQYTAEEMVREFAAQQGGRKLPGKKSANASEQDRLRDAIERRKRVRSRQAVAADKTTNSKKKTRARVQKVAVD